jgi:hypothetical protein
MDGPWIVDNRNFCSRCFLVEDVDFPNDENTASAVVNVPRLKEETAEWVTTHAASKMFAITDERLTVVSGNTIFQRCTPVFGCHRDKFPFDGITLSHRYGHFGCKVAFDHCGVWTISAWMRFYFNGRRMNFIRSPRQQTTVVPVIRPKFGWKVQKWMVVENLSQSTVKGMIQSTYANRNYCFWSSWNSVGGLSICISGPAEM